MSFRLPVRDPFTLHGEEPRTGVLFNLLCDVHFSCSRQQRVPARWNTARAESVEGSSAPIQGLRFLDRPGP